MHQNIDIIKPDFILIEGTLFNVNNICTFRHSNVTGKQTQIFTTCDSDIDNVGYHVNVSVADIWNALVQLRKP